MNTIILKSFITRLDFISKRIKYQNTNQIEIILSNIENNSEKYYITGFAIIKKLVDETETINFNILVEKSTDILLIKSNYKSDKSDITDKNEEIDTFIITESKINQYLNRKNKYLIHLVDGNIKQAYIVNKKYKFENGINENYSKVNMDNKDNYNNINNIYSSNKSKK